MEVKNTNQNTDDANIPSLFVNYELLDFEIHQSSLKIYEINGKTYIDLDVNDVYQEFRLYAERISTKETPPKKLQFDVQIVKSGYIIDSTIYLHNHHYNTIITSEGYQQCYACDEVIEDIDCHVGSGYHVSNLEAFPPLEEYRLDFLRLRKDNYHCGVCNVIFHKSTSNSHVAGQTHANNKIFASQKAAETLLKRNALRNRNNDTKNKNNDMRNKCNDARNHNNDVPINKKSNKIDKVLIDSHVSVKTEKMIFEIAFFTYHMISISKSKDNSFHCMACKIKDSTGNLRKHINDVTHKSYLEAFKINHDYENHLIRQDEKWCHCSTCNTLHYPGGTEDHIMKHDQGKISSESAKPISNFVIKNKENTSSDAHYDPQEEINFDVVNYKNRNNVSTNNENRNNDIAYSLINEKCIVYIFGFHIQVSLLSLNVIFRYNLDFYCGFCRTVFTSQYLQDHMKSIMHNALLKSTPAVLLHGYNYIRLIHNLPHCGICHSIIKPKLLLYHLQEPSHIIQTNIALGNVRQPSSPQVAKVTPNETKIDENLKKDLHIKIVEVGDNNNEIEKRISETKERIDEIKNINNMTINVRCNSIDETRILFNDVHTSNVTKNAINEPINRNEAMIEMKNTIGNGKSKIDETMNETENAIDEADNTVNETKNEIKEIKNEPIKILSRIYKTKNIINDTKNTNKETKKTIISKAKNGIDVMEKAMNKKINTINKGKNINNKIKNVNVYKDITNCNTNDAAINKIDETNDVIEELINETKNKTIDSKETELYTELNKSVIREIKLKFPNDWNAGIFDAEVIIVCKKTHMLIPFTCFNTLVPIGNGDRYCFLCGVSVENDTLMNHITTESHMGMLKKIKFLGTYDSTLIRQNVNLYHCGICNVILRNPEIRNHVKWTEHKKERKKRKFATVTKLERESKGFENKLFCTQIEDTTSRGNFKEIVVKESFVIKNEGKKLQAHADEKDFSSKLSLTNNDEFDSQRRSKIVFIKDLNIQLVLKWDVWHSINKKKKNFSCILCNVKMNVLYLDFHISSDAHKKNLEKPFLKEYFPTLIRKISELRWHCLICNIALYVESIFCDHIDNKRGSHTSKLAAILKVSSEGDAEEMLFKNVLVV